MSHYVDITLEIKDEKALVLALERLGFKGHVEIYKEAQHLYGYQGDVREQTAHVILRRKYVGNCSNDIGFEKLADGRYHAHISEFDSKRYDKAWQGKLSTYYGVEKAKLECGQKNWKYVEDIDEKERPRLRITL
jgi:hypothetical protein